MGGSERLSEGFWKPHSGRRQAVKTDRQLSWGRQRLRAGEGWGGTLTPLQPGGASSPRALIPPAGGQGYCATGRGTCRCVQASGVGGPRVGLWAGRATSQATLLGHSETGLPSLGPQGQDPRFPATVCPVDGAGPGGFPNPAGQRSGHLAGRPLCSTGLRLGCASWFTSAHSPIAPSAGDARGSYFANSRTLPRPLAESGTGRFPSTDVSGRTEARERNGLVGGGWVWRFVSVS